MFKKYDAYKDSDVQWIGEIPTSWFNDRLGTILEPISKKGNADKPLLSITREKGVILRDVEGDSENHNFIPDDLSNYKLIVRAENMLIKELGIAREEAEVLLQQYGSVRASVDAYRAKQL